MNAPADLKRFLDAQEKKSLLEKKIVLCQELCDNPKLLSDIGVSSNRIEIILREGNELCKNENI